MSSRKRGRAEFQQELIEVPREPGLLQQIRNMWEFANLCQWIFIFGRVVKIDENLDIDDLEMECLKTRSTVLPEIGLALLKFVSSHRGLTPEIFDEYTRRQYQAKAQHRNPFGDEEEPAKFVDFDIFTKIRVLQQLTIWTLGNPDRIRAQMEEQKDSDQTIWRIEPFGWDSDDRTYFILDDNRLYRRTDPPPPPAIKTPKFKKHSKKAKAALRASKRRKVSEPADSEIEAAEDAEPEQSEQHEEAAEKEVDGFGGMKWECIAVTFDEVNAFVASIEKSRDPNEKVLCKRVKEDLLPLLEKQEEARRRKVAQRERELLNLEKLATAKRSSRIAGKMEHQKAEEEAREAERKKLADLVMAKKEQEKWMKLEKERESRMMTREQRLKEREARRILHEDELANLSSDSKQVESGTGRLSERHLKAEIEKKKQALEELAEEEDWIFDCICGAYGQIDDGTHSIACEKCNIWQHSKCVGVSQSEAERDDFHYICSTCQRRAKEAERAKLHGPIKINFKRPESPATAKPYGSPAIGITQKTPAIHTFQQSPSKQASQPAYSGQPLTWQSPYATQPSPYATQQSPYATHQSPYATQQVAPAASQSKSNGAAYSTPRALITVANGGVQETSSHAPNWNSQQPLPQVMSSHAFSSPRLESPTSLPPPVQPQQYSFTNGGRESSSTSTAPQPTSNPNGTFQHPAVHTFHSPYAQPQATPAPRSVNGASKMASGELRPNSMTFPSPTPDLTPVSKSNHAIAYSYSSSPPTNSPSSAQPKPVMPRSTLQTEIPPGHSHDGAHSSILPPAATGYSPTKHSPPPRSTTSNGSFSAPSILPPVTLTSSPQLQNLSPPVKPSEPERPREYGQSVGS